MTRWMVPILLSSLPYTGVPSTLSLPISETVSRRLSTVVAIVLFSLWLVACGLSARCAVWGNVHSHRAFRHKRPARGFCHCPVAGNDTAGHQKGSTGNHPG